MIKWRDVKDDPPTDGMDCLTAMKYGLISGTYDAKGNVFNGYFFMEICWYAEKWVPVDEIYIYIYIYRVTREEGRVEGFTDAVPSPKLDT